MSDFQARDENYDIVVIGGGLGGLTAGALLAAAGKKTVVVERDGEPGGYARAVVGGGYTFDRADHLIMSCVQDGPFGQGVVDAVLRHLGVADRCDFLRVDDPFYDARYPGFSLAVPAGREAFVDAHARAFPDDAGGFRRLAELSGQAFEEFLRFPTDPRITDVVRTPRTFPTLFRYRNATVEDVVRASVSDPRAAAVYTTLWPWVGSPPSEASFVMWAAMMGAYVDDGPYYCRGGFGVLVDAIVAGLERAGGDLVRGVGVARILTEGKRVRGVALEDGKRISAPVVIAAIDALDTFAMVPAATLPSRYRRRLDTMELTPSVAALYLATDLDVRALGAQHDTTVFTGWDHDEASRSWARGEVNAVSIAIPSITDPSLAPAGEHVVMVQGAMPSDGYGPLAADGTARRMVHLAEQVLPGLGEHLTYVHGADGAGAPDLPLHTTGPIYGWSLVPHQSGARRLPQRTPLQGLYLAGQWTRPGPGVMAVIGSGLAAARLVLGAARGGLLPVGLPAVRTASP